MKGEQANFQRVECLRLSTSVTLMGSSRLEHSPVHRQKCASPSPEAPPPSDTSTPMRLPPSKTSYTVRIPSEQEPQHILLGWTAPDFTFSPADVVSVMNAVAPYEQPVETCLDQSVRVESSSGSRVVYSACVMVPLVHLLEEASMGMLMEVTCSVNCDKREVEYAVDSKVVLRLPLQVCGVVSVWCTCHQLTFDLCTL